MARISVTQNINLQFDSATMIPLVRGVNDIEEILSRYPMSRFEVAHVLRHPYLQAHMKAGSASIVPDPADPEDLALAAEEIARKRRADAEAWKQVKKDQEAADTQKASAIAAAVADGEKLAPSEPQPVAADPKAGPQPDETKPSAPVPLPSTDAPAPASAAAAADGAAPAPTAEPAAAAAPAASTEAPAAPAPAAASE